MIIVKVANWEFHFDMFKTAGLANSKKPKVQSIVDNRFGEALFFSLCFLFSFFCGKLLDSKLENQSLCFLHPHADNMAESALLNGQNRKNSVRKLDDGLAESGVKIETVYFDPSMMDEYVRLAAEAEEKQKKFTLSPSPASTLISPPPIRMFNASSSNVTTKFNGKVLLNTKRPRLNYALTKVPKAEPPKNAPAVLVLGNDIIRPMFGSNPLPLKRKLTLEVDGTLKSIFLADSEDQAKKPAIPIGFRCTWEGCGYVNGTEGNTVRHIRKLHFEGSETSTVIDNNLICNYVSPLYESE